MNYHIETQRTALQRLLITIAGMAGLLEDCRGPSLNIIGRIAEADRTQLPRPETLSRRIHRIIGTLLKPAEAAARRLAIALSKGMAVSVVEAKRPLKRPLHGPHASRPLHRVPRSPVNGGGSAPPPAGSGSSPAQRGRGTAERGGGGVVENGESEDCETASPLTVRLYPTLPPSPYLPKGAVSGAGFISRVIPGHKLGINIPPPPKRIRTIPKRLSIFDPAYRFPSRRKRVKGPRSIPRILSFDGPYVPLPKPRSPDDQLSVTRLHARIEVLARTLDDLPAMAARYAKWKARVDAEDARAKALDAAQDREANLKPGVTRTHRDALSAGRVASTGRTRYRRRNALRIGLPAGLRRRKKREVDDILANSHSLAWSVDRRADTS